MVFSILMYNRGRPWLLEPKKQNQKEQKEQLFAGLPVTLSLPVSFKLTFWIGKVDSDGLFAAAVAGPVRAQHQDTGSHGHGGTGSPGLTTTPSL